MPSPDVNNAAGCAKIIGVSHSFVGALAHRDHRTLEERCLLRVGPEPSEPRGSKDLFEGRLTCLNRIEKLREGLIGFAVDHQYEIARARRQIGAKRRAQFGLREAARRYFAKHAFAGQQTHDAIECLGIRSGGLG